MLSMASIITMRSDEFLDSFIKKFDVTNYNFIAISDDIKAKNDEPNVFALKALLPPSKALTYMINGNDKKEYYKKYIKYLMKPEIDIFVTTIVKLAVVEDSNVVLICSKAEDEMKYLNVLRKYIEDVYGTKVFKYEKYKKKPNKCESIIDKKKTVKIITTKIETAQKNHLKINIDKNELSARLKHMSDKAIKDFAKSNGIKIKKSMSRKEIIKKVQKALK